jgi:hypothetical protein
MYITIRIHNIQNLTETLKTTAMYTVIDNRTRRI